MGYNIAVVGATGNVGREMLAILAEREFPFDEIYAIASRRSIGVDCSCGDMTLKCHDIETFEGYCAAVALNIPPETIRIFQPPKDYFQP